MTESANRCGRNPQDIILIAVSKQKSVSLIGQVAGQGQMDFGENYVQEFLQKWSSLRHLPLRWHFVGHLQRRKVKDVVEKVHLIHSLDSFQLACEIEKRAMQRRTVQQCLVEVNTSLESSKSGLAQSEVSNFLKEISKFRYLQVTGLMTIPQLFDDPARGRPFFKALRDLRELINATGCYRTKLHHLSMGMSHDFGIAIEEGATIVRIGTAIFGTRNL